LLDTATDGTKGHVVGAGAKRSRHQNSSKYRFPARLEAQPADSQGARYRDWRRVRLSCRRSIKRGFNAAWAGSFVSRRCPSSLFASPGSVQRVSAAQLQPFIQFGGVRIHRRSSGARRTMSGQSPLYLPAPYRLFASAQIGGNLFPAIEAASSSQISDAAPIWRGQGHNWPPFGLLSVDDRSCPVTALGPAINCHHYRT